MGSSIPSVIIPTLTSLIVFMPLVDYFVWSFRVDLSWASLVFFKLLKSSLTSSFRQMEVTELPLKYTFKYDDEKKRVWLIGGIPSVHQLCAGCRGDWSCSPGSSRGKKTRQKWYGGSPSHNTSLAKWQVDNSNMQRGNMLKQQPAVWLTARINIHVLLLNTSTVVCVCVCGGGEES